MKNRKTLTIADLKEAAEMLMNEPLTKIKEINYYPHPLYKRKTYVLTLSKTFMKGHPKAGEPTNFKELYLQGLKIHTIRAGEYWRKVVEEVNAGRAILSVREWSGKPYASKQAEIGRHEKLGWQNIRIGNIDLGYLVTIDKNYLLADHTIKHLANNDGLNLLDFQNWFDKKFFDGGIIHFTDFRYA